MAVKLLNQIFLLLLLFITTSTTSTTTTTTTTTSSSSTTTTTIAAAAATTSTITTITSTTTSIISDTSKNTTSYVLHHVQKQNILLHGGIIFKSSQCHYVHIAPNQNLTMSLRSYATSLRFWGYKKYFKLLWPELWKLLYTSLMVINSFYAQLNWALNVSCL